MRLTVLALLLTLAGVAPAAAQISYGAKVGVNFADVSFDADEDVPTSGRTGLLAGVFVTIPLGWLTVQPEAIYTVKGTSLDIGGVTSDYIVDYVEVPVLARLRLLRNAYVVAGPSMAFRLRARNRIAFGGSTEEFDLEDDVESFDMGIVGGVGLEAGRWVVDARYTHGLSDLDTDSSDDVRMRNRVFSVSAGIRF
ncbi:MAG: porin family protein [Vicinamibacterales bacterium]